MRALGALKRLRRGLLPARNARRLAAGPIRAAARERGLGLQVPHALRHRAAQALGGATFEHRIDISIDISEEIWAFPYHFVAWDAPRPPLRRRSGCSEDLECGQDCSKAELGHFRAAVLSAYDTTLEGKPFLKPSL